MQHHSPTSRFDFSFVDWVPTIIIVAIALVYLVLLFFLYKKNKSWNSWHTASFMLGIFLLVAAMYPSLVQWAHKDIRGHMVQHLLTAMFAPIFLVMGAPIALALKSLPVRISRGLTFIMKSGLFRFFSHPITAMLLNVGGMYLLYLTPLYNATIENPYLHHLLHIHFLTAGYLFTWSIIGLDPVPKRPGLRLKIFVLFLSMAAHAFLSKFMYAYLLPLNSPHSKLQIREGAKMMYYWGDLSELILVIILFATWYYKKGANKERFFLPY